MISYRFISFTICALILLISCNQTDYPQGKRYYDAYCGNCHMENGDGLSSLIPSLYQSDYIKSKQDHLPCIIRNGIGSIDDTTLLSMPGNADLSDIEIVNIINYINTSWENTSPPQTLTKVNTLLNKCE